MTKSSNSLAGGILSFKIPLSDAHKAGIYNAEFVIIVRWAVLRGSIEKLSLPYDHEDLRLSNLFQNFYQNFAFIFRSLVVSR